MFERFWRLYETDYKKLMLIPIIIILFFSGVIINHKLTTGSYFNKDISLKGGTSITYYVNESINGVTEWLVDSWGEDAQLVVITNPFGGFKGYDIRVGVELNASDVASRLSVLVGREVTQSEFSMGYQGASIANDFFQSSIIIIIVSFLMMGLVILYYFKSVIPAISITLSTMADVIVVIGVLDLLGVSLSVASIGALLMLVGLSTDSDILLASNIIKNRESGLIDRLKKTMKTQLTMGLAAITTSTVMFLLTNIDLIRSIALILMIGSISDILNTQILSAGLQRMYRERKSR
ncbi:MAG: hypothetical protein WC307_04215 [Candidatus Nanoarchaeia archaeon]|jgi:preprotein translocase subunit SecF